MDKKELIKNNTIMKKIFSILALLFGLLPCMSLTAYAASVSYVDGNGTSQTVEATELEAAITLHSYCEAIKANKGITDEQV